MKLRFAKTLSAVALSATLLTGCVDDLNREPFYDITSAKIYDDPANYKGVLAKIYGGYALTGNQGPAGRPDIAGIDEGFSNYLRIYWNLQELTTDAAVVAWNDPGLPNIHAMTWSSDNPWIKGMYYRIFYQIPLCNEFIRESSDDKLSDRGFSDAVKAEIRTMRAEVRLLRALSYWHALDLFGSVPFLTEADKPGSNLPRQAGKAEIFNYIESECKAIEGLLPAPKANEYGRADRAAVWTLLAKLYLNAKTYVNVERNSDCVEYCKRVINSNAYSLQPNFKHLFLTDNNTSPEVILPITFHGLRTQTWGGMTFLVHAPVGGRMKPAEFGINGGWFGYRTTQQYVAQFPDTNDRRYPFFTDGQKLNVDTLSLFNNGYAVAKFRNVNQAGQPGTDQTGNHCDTDYPMFRLADVYLMYAEAVKRGGAGGDEATALGYLNQLRTRAYGNASGNITSYDLDYILAERGRELIWEGHRRTDLIRFGKFTTGYNWAWKGGVKDGQDVADYRTIFPIPIDDMIANPNLKQNPGY